MINIIFWTWCFPQSFVGLVIYCISQFSKTLVEVRNYRKTKITFIRSKYLKNWAGVSLGKYIFVNAQYLKTKEEAVDWIIRHEYGHAIQNFILGPLYLLIIFLPSASLFLLIRINKKYKCKYHKMFPENWANKLAGITGDPPKSLSEFNTKD